MSLTIYNQNGFTASVERTLEWVEINYKHNGSFLEAERLMITVQGAAVKFGQPNAILNHKPFDRTTLINHCHGVLAKYIEQQRVKKLIDAAWDELYRPTKLVPTSEVIGEMRDDMEDSGEKSAVEQMPTDKGE